MGQSPRLEYQKEHQHQPKKDGAEGGEQPGCLRGEGRGQLRLGLRGLAAGPDARRGNALGERRDEVIRVAKLALRQDEQNTPAMINPASPAGICVAMNSGKI